MNEIFLNELIENLVMVCDPALKEAVEHKLLENEAHGAPTSVGAVIIWLLEYGAKVYLATVPQEKGGAR